MSAPNTLSKLCTIRRATQTDINLISQLAHNIWPIAYVGVLTHEQIANMLEKIYSPENLAREMNSSHFFWLASFNSHAVGYASAYQEGNVVWLRKLYTDQELKGEGIGTTLLNAVVAAFKSAQEISLLVNAMNLNAQAFYIRRGFVKTGEMPVQMGDYHFIDYVYSKPLATSHV